MTDAGGTAILIYSRSGQASCDELARLAASGEAPRTDYVELARVLDADVIDSHYLASRAAPLSRGVAHFGMALGQVIEVVLRRRYRHILAWHDRFGVMLGSLLKLTRAHRDVVVKTTYLTSSKRSLFYRCFRIDSHLRAITVDSRVQLQIAASRLGIPFEKLYLLPQPVDECFFRPDGGPTENMICSVGTEARDYGTLVRAVAGLDVDVEIAAGKTPVPDLLPNVRLREFLGPLELRRLYSRSRFVVVPVLDMEFNPGTTVVKEAMAMGKAVILSRSRSQRDENLSDGVHGIYVPPGDPAALRAAIQYLVDHPEEAERMGCAGRALIEKHYQLEAYVGRMATVMRGNIKPPLTGVH